MSRGESKARKSISLIEGWLSKKGLPRRQQSSSLANRIRTLGAAGAGIVAGCGGVASADLVTVPINQVFLINDLGGATFDFDLDSDGNDDVLVTSDFIHNFAQLSVNLESTNGVFIDLTSFDEPSELTSPTGVTTNSAAQVFQFGELITSSTSTLSISALLAFNLDFSTGTGDGHFFNTGGPRIAGFSFLIDGQPHNALMQASVSLSPGATQAVLSIENFAYESVSGAALTAVPEPSLVGALALLATGAAGLEIRRRRDSAN